MSEIVYLNGEFLPRSEAMISPDDRGFIFGDGVYEVIKYYNGTPFCFEEHMDRLRRSLKEISIDYPERAMLKKIFSRLMSENHLMNVHAGLYLQITRGVNPRVHYFPERIIPTVYVFTFPLPSFTESLEKGIKVITHSDIRWLRCDIKSTALLPNTMLFNQAVEQGAGECILIRDGLVTEATHSSVFGVKEGKVITHPLSPFILPGITRQVMLELCSRHAIPYEERPVLADELFHLDELFITGTGSEVTPVVEVDGKKVGAGQKKPGEITRFLQSKFFEMVP